MRGAKERIDAAGGHSALTDATRVVIAHGGVGLSLHVAMTGVTVCEDP